jgi:hypothetical protein
LHCHKLLRIYYPTFFTDSPPCEGPDCTCFSGDDNVTLFDGSSKAMRDLQVGDVVWTVSDDMKTLVLSEIFIMPHNVRNKTSEFSYSANIIVRIFCTQFI